MLGLYAVEWIKHGPSGMISANKPDAKETVSLLIEDLLNLPPCAKPDRKAIQDLLYSRDVHVVTFQDWEQINRAEIERGQEKGKPREKFLTIEEMLVVLN